MTACNNVAKGFLIITGICYLFCAGGLSYIGIWVFSTYDHFDEVADSTLTLLPASIILAVSAFMCIIGVLACIAAFKSNKLLLSVFFCLILLVFVGEILAGALGYVYRSKVENILEEDLFNAVNDYTNNTVYREQLDYMQSEFHCCGVHNASDWLKSATWKRNHSNVVPESCCRPVKNSTLTCMPVLDKKVIYTQGCLDKLEDKFKNNLVYIASSVVCMAAIQLLALISTCVLVCRTREQTPYTILGEQIGGGLRV